MTTSRMRRGHPTGLTGRHFEREALDGLIEAVRAGESRVLVMRGEPGVGKTALLEYLAERASAAGCRLAHAGLHQLCGPMLGHADRLPAPQRSALRVVFGVAAGPPPDRFLLGLAVLTLLAEVAGDDPLICLIDDVQWFDQASAQALGVTA